MTVQGEEVLDDPSDGLPATPVGVWAKEKHQRLAVYVEITREVRRKFVGPTKAGATFIDVYCGAGRAFVRGTGEYIDGSPLVAWKAAVASNTGFSEVFLNDQEESFVDAATKRLRKLKAPVKPNHGSAEDFINNLLPKLNPAALHFAFVDPFGLELPFGLFRRLATLRRIDVLIHVSAMDLHRNWALYSKAQHSPLDVFNPGWRTRVQLAQADENARVAFVHDWVEQLKGLGFGGEVRFDLIRGLKNQPLYWLVLIAKHALAASLWKKTVQTGKTPGLF
jgi:three-Cys-motif partner protein